MKSIEAYLLEVDDNLNHDLSIKSDMVIYFDNEHMLSIIPYTWDDINKHITNCTPTASCCHIEYGGIYTHNDWILISTGSSGSRNPFFYNVYNSKEGEFILIFSPSRKICLKLICNKESKYKTLYPVEKRYRIARDTYLDVPFRKYPHCKKVINLIDNYFFSENVKYNSKFDYIDYIKCVLPSSELQQFVLGKTSFTEYEILGIKSTETTENTKPVENTPKPISENVADKQQYKREVKRRVGKKFKIGKHYYLRSKSYINGSSQVKEFELKQIVYAIEGKEVASLIMKQVAGINNAIFTLNNEDCKKLHIKFEPGLQVMSMYMNWIPKNENYK